jgi:hypothetical protein
MFHCRHVQGSDLLVADFGIECGGERWFSHLGVNIFFLLVYPVGVPLALFATLRYFHNDQLRDPRVRIAYGILYEAYSSDAWYFELVRMC